MGGARPTRGPGARALSRASERRFSHSFFSLLATARLLLHFLLTMSAKKATRPPVEVRAFIVLSTARCGVTGKGDEGGEKAVCGKACFARGSCRRANKPLSVPRVRRLHSPIPGRTNPPGRYAESCRGEGG